MDWFLQKWKNIRQAVYHPLNKSQQKTNWIFWRKKKNKHKKQHYVKSSSKGSESEYYIPKKRKQKKW